MEASETKFRICPFCEATCGLAVEMRGREVVRVRGDDDDVFSHGFVCPKGAALADLDTDPDRLRTPLVRRNGELVEATWDEAFAEVERRLLPIIQAHGNDAVAVYLGNPTAHKIDLTLYGQVLIKGLRTRNIFSASTVDQIPKQLASGLMFGGYLSVAVPDIDRTDYLLVLGANPFDSNGSLWTVPDFPGRLRALRQRGGRCVVVDPRRTRTAQAADEHVFLRPATDVHFLAAIVHTLQQEDLIDLGRLAAHCNGIQTLDGLFADFSPEAVGVHCGVPAASIRRIARELAGAERAAVYARIGTCTQSFGTTVSWLVDLCNVLTGNLDREGGAMFPRAAAFAANTRGRPGVGRGVRTGRRHSRVRNAPEVMGELPVACLAEEIETPGDGQIRALFTVAGNPVLSTPNGERLDRALAGLDFMVSLDIYLNETTRHADVIFPGLSVLEEAHFDVAFPQLSYRNAARYSAPLVDPPADRPHEWQTLLRLAGIVMGRARTPTSTRSTTSSSPRRFRARLPTSTRTCSTATRRSCSSPYGRGAAPHGWSTSRCAPAHMATPSVPTPMGFRSPCSRRIRTVSISARSNRACPRCCAPLRARSNSPPICWSATWSGSALRCTPITPVATCA